MKKQRQNEADLLGLVTRIQEQLTALDKKMDSILNKSLPQSIEGRPPLKPSFPQPMNAQGQGRERQNDYHKGRPMHRATCADCKKECELPFKPSGDRPVYCKECFLRRRTSNTLKVITDNKLKEAPPVPAVIHAAINIPEPSVKEKKKPAVVKKSSGKKKLTSKKKKK
jgi:CxxC-x17-CxxC domain-containing protein